MIDVQKYSPTLRLAKLVGNKATKATLNLFNNLKNFSAMEESSLSVYKYLFEKSHDHPKPVVNNTHKEVKKQIVLKSCYLHVFVVDNYKSIAID